MSVAIIPEHKKLSFSYGEHRYDCALLKGKFSGRKIVIKVHPDCRVVVAAPEDAELKDVQNALTKRSRWIYEQIREFKKLQEHALPRQYVSGESHYYLGKQYLLKVEQQPGAAQSVKMTRGRLEVSVKQKSPEKIRALLDEWYKARAKETFAKRLTAMLEQALWVPDKPSIRVLTMKTQWGSCSPKGLITLNPLLVKAPRECIDYVILHELCHIAEHNHSERFYRLMGQVMPNWEKTKEKLDGMAFEILS